MADPHTYHMLKGSSFEWRNSIDAQGTFVNVSFSKEVDYEVQKITTGIFKEPVKRRIMLKTLNLEGDRQADLKVHGGPDKAAYAYPMEHSYPESNPK